MVYNSVTEIFEGMDETRRRLCASVEDLSAGQEAFRPAPDNWSIAEIIEHLSMIERQLSQLFRMLLKKIEAEGRTRAVGDEAAPFPPVSIENFVAQSRTQKFNAPDTARPTGEVALADSLARLSETRAALHELRPRIERVDGTAAKYPHPAFGPLDLYQWLVFIAAHEERHLRQIERLKQSPEFETQGEAAARS